MGERYVLGGRAFVPVTESTVEQDYHAMALVRAAGLDRLTLGADESAEEFAVRLLGECLASGKVLELIGSLLVPEETEPEAWTPALARETASHLGRIRDPKEKGILQGVLLSCLLPFLESGLVSLRRIATSSGQPAKEKSAIPQASDTGSGLPSFAS